MSTSAAPTFILATSRSGSTLLRFIIDSHPDFACPPETQVASACAHLARTWDSLDHAREGDRARGAIDDPITVTPHAAEAIRDAVSRAYGAYTDARGKKRWCDKSLDSYMFTDTLIQVFPDARFIFLIRHCMDVVASGVEICPWGLSRFGFDPFVSQFPGNSVAAIASYWLACNMQNLEFAEKYPDNCIIIRYEDLVAAPEETAAEIFGFLGAEYISGMAAAAFSTPHDSNGPGDEKIWFTRSVTSDTVGRGVIVPSKALPPPLLDEINRVLSRFRYKLVGEEWNAAVGRVDPRADVAATTPGDPGGEDDDMAAAIRAIAERITTGDAAGRRDIPQRWTSVADTSVRFIVQSADGRYREMRWNFSAPDVPLEELLAWQASAAGGHDGAQLTLFIGTPAAWLDILSERSNLVVEMSGSRLRCIDPTGNHRLRSDRVHAVSALLGLTQIPVAR
jgi:protein-tyrosine sulfotransferase